MEDSTKHLFIYNGFTGPGGNNVSSIIPFTITRLQDDPDDTGYDGASDYVFVFDVDFHKPINSPGSRTEYSK